MDRRVQQQQERVSNRLFQFIYLKMGPFGDAQRLLKSFLAPNEPVA
jgi:hypothetical protein